MSSKFSCPSSFQTSVPTAFVTVHVIVLNGVSAPVGGASVSLNGPAGFSYSGVTDGSGMVAFANVGAPALHVTLSITASGFNPYTNTLTIETLPMNVTYVVGPPGSATGSQIQLPALVTGGGSGICHTDFSIAQPGGIPGRPNKRWMRGNFSGHVVPGAGFVNGGSTTPVDQVLTYFLDRYSPSTQATILANYAAQGFTHFQLSWPDSRSGNGQSVAQFVSTCQAVKAAGLYTIVFLLSKVYDPANMNGAAVAPIVDPVIAALNAANAADIYCVGWELNLFNDPGTAGGPLAPFQDLINHIAGQVVPTYPLYVHFSGGVSAWQPNGSTTSAFWQANVNQLTGLLWQEDRGATPDCPSLQARIADTQIRFGGGFGFPSDSGFGHPFDLVAFELGANEMFYGSLTEAQGNALGLNAIQSPIPNPGVSVMGYMNGCTGNP